MDEYDFDIHITYEHSVYDGDSSTKCKVTYPPARPDQQPFVVEYDDYAGDIPASKVAANAADDIAEYMRDPEGWLEEQIKKSGTDWEQLRELQHDLKMTQQKAESSQRTTAYYQERAKGYQEQIKQIEARLNKAG